MIIFNTTYCVSDKMYGSFIKWLNVTHIPQMLSSGLFFDPVVSKVLVEEESMEGTSISVQLRSENIEIVSKWKKESGAIYNKDLRALFGDDVVSFSICMEVM